MDEWTCGKELLLNLLSQKSRRKMRIEKISMDALEMNV
jgi:hypothetical protein